MAPERRIAFALGGLAGNNAHGAGFLQAAMTRKIEPCIISCTSGQILWTYRYLLEKEKLDGNLRELLEEDIRRITSTHNFDWDTALLALFGKPGVFRPAWLEFINDLQLNALRSMTHFLHNGWKTFFLKEIFDMIPGRILVPLFPDDFFSKICTAFRNSGTGIVFNTFNPKEGHEIVYINEAAGDLYAESKSGYRRRTGYREITEEAIKDALWIYQYGFDQKDSTYVDGAYYRQIMLSELAIAEEIFVARPIRYYWAPSPLPTGYFGIEDLKTEIAFNGSYAGERDKIELMNKLIDEGFSQGKYHRVNLHEVEMKRPRGFFDYLYENADVFDDAYHDAIAEFDRFDFSRRTEQPHALR